LARSAVTLVDLLAARADRAYGYTFSNQGGEDGSLPFSQLDGQARAIAAQLQAEQLAGERALLLYPSGAAYVEALFSCVYAGVIAVPVYPPDPARLDRTLPRLLEVIADADPAVALTTSDLLPVISDLLARCPNDGRPRLIATDAVAAGDHSGWRRPNPDPADTALLQYTSGSTAKPKGVMLSHANLLHNSEVIKQCFGNTRDTIAVSWLPLYHDMGLIGGVLQPLYGDFRIILLSPTDFLARPLCWLEAISYYRATTSGGPNFAYELCVRRASQSACDGLNLSTWTVAFNGAEPVRAATLERFARTFAAYGFSPDAFLPCYGLAEATLMVTGKPAGEPVYVGRFDTASLAGNQAILAGPTADRTVTLISSGRPSAELGVSVSIADPVTAARPPAGQVGEVLVTGPGVSAGFWRGREPPPSNGTLHTGDLGFLHDGELFIVGRTKDVIVVRGRNVYPQDIEQAAQNVSPLLRPGCGAAFALAPDDEPDADHIVLVQEVSKQAEDADLADLPSRIRAAVTAALDVQVRSVILVEPGTVPKTSSGKLQRGQCKQALTEGTLAVRNPDHAAKLPAGRQPILLALPTVERQQRIASYLCERLGAAAGLASFALSTGAAIDGLGLDSLMRAELMHQIETDLAVRLPPAALEAGGTIFDLAGLITGLLDHDLAGHDPASHTEAEPAAQLSAGQRSLWFLHRLDPADPSYHIARAFETGAEFLPQAFDEAFCQLIARHETLHTTYAERDGEPLPVPVPAPATVLRQRTAADSSEAGTQALLRAEADRPFDLSRDLPVRAVLVRRPGSDPVLLLVVHHIAADLWSFEILLDEMRVLYPACADGRTAALPALAARYADFAAYQAKITAAEPAELRDYWLDQLAGELSICELPDHRPRPAAPGWCAQVRTVRLGADLSARIRELAASAGGSVFTVLLSALQAIMHRLTGGTDILIGTPAAGRSHADFARLVGYLVNTIVMRADLSDNPTFEALVERNSRAVRAALAHADYPFQRLVEILQPVRDPGHTPLFQVMLVAEEARKDSDLAGASIGIADAPLDLGGVRLRTYPLPESAVPFDLTVAVATVGAELITSWQFRTDVLDECMVDRMAAQLSRFLAAVTSSPALRIGYVPLLGAEELRALTDRNDTEAAVPTQSCMHELIIDRARRDPGAIAVRSRDAQVSYGQLTAQASKIAVRLQGLGVGPEVPVAVLMRRTPDIVAAILGVLMAGGAYVPIDPAAPHDRVAAILADCRAPVLLTDQVLAAAPGPGCAVVNAGQVLGQPIEADRPLADTVMPGNLAYVMYTSGSTGQPKGVMATHENLVQSTHARALTFANRISSFLLISSFAFDSSIAGLFWTLYEGGTLVLPDPGSEQDPWHHRDMLASENISHFESVPSLYQILLELIGPGDLPALRSVVVAGEACPSSTWELHDRLLPGVAFTNEYGPTETTVWCTAHTASGPIGRPALPMGGPIANAKLYVLDRRACLLPDGVPGELCVGGPGVTRGYLGEPARTALAYIPDPYSGIPGARLYRTGDRVCYLADGELEFLGRVDGQLNVRGLRVEPAEIEHALREHPAVRQAAITVRRDDSGDVTLAAYVVAAPGAVTAAAVRKHLLSRLPAYLVPSLLDVVSELPLTTQGKIDYAALAEISPPDDGPAVPPRDEIERFLRDSWYELTGYELRSVHDDMFAAGGHSLHATRMVARVRSALCVELPVREVFEAPSVAELAELIRHKLRGPVDTVAGPADKGRGGWPAPLSPAQHRLWFLDQIVPGNRAYNVPVAIRLRGELDVTALAQALDQVVQRHETLRTAVDVVDGRPVARLLDFHLDLPVTVLDGDAESALPGELLGDACRHLTLAEGQLVRARLIRLGDRDHVLSILFHHLVCDGWSLGLLSEEISARYTAGAKAPALPALPIQYCDYARWHQDVAATGAGARSLAYWTEALEHAARLRLPTDYERPALQSFAGSTVAWALDAVTTRRLESFSADDHVTLFMVLISAFAVLIAREGYSDDLVIGTPVSGRSHGELDSLIGLFANTIVLRISTQGNPAFRQLALHTRATCLDAYAHQDLPFERVIEALQPMRDLGANPLFQVVFALQNAPIPAPRLAGLDTEILDIHSGTSKFDLTVSLLEADGGLAGMFEYSTALFDQATIERLARQFTAVLRAIADDPGCQLATLYVRCAEQESGRAAVPLATSPPADPSRDADLAALARALRKRITAQTTGTMLAFAPSNPGQVTNAWWQLVAAQEVHVAQPDEPVDASRLDGIKVIAACGADLPRILDTVAAVPGMAVSHVVTGPDVPQSLVTRCHRQLGALVSVLCPVPGDAFCWTCAPHTAASRTLLGESLLGAVPTACDRFGQPVGAGPLGELCVSLPGLADPPVRTGLLVRRLADDSLERHGFVSGDQAPRPAPPAPFIAPRNPVEAVLAQTVCELLERPAVGVHDDFFDLGGHSLVAMVFVARVQQIFQLELTVKDLFEMPTVAAVASRVIDAERIPGQATTIAKIWQQVRAASD
jgi:amino acid adenylation domain-containing protein